MEILKDNFEEHCKSIQDAINEADFISIDGEFTGLNSGKTVPSHLLDTPEERYCKLRDGSSEVLMLQVGLCTFKRDPQQNQFKVQSYSFRTFPRPFDRASPDVRFLCQASSIDFLCQHNFDFNKTFAQGIGYLSRQEEIYVRENLKEKFKRWDEEAKQVSDAANTPGKSGDAGSGFVMEVPENKRAFMQDKIKEAEAFLADVSRTKLVFSGTSAFDRKLIYSKFKARFPQLQLSTEVKGKERLLVLIRALKGEERVLWEQQRRQKEMDRVDEAVGFSRIIRTLSESDKVIVGHNMSLDLLHTLRQFHAPLPEDYEEFKHMAHSVFPRLLDTKVMANSQPLVDFITDSTLDQLRKQLSAKPFKMPKFEFPPEFPSFVMDDEKCHDAAFDAYLTGACFAAMAAYMGSLVKPPSSHISADAPILQPYVNKICMMRSLDTPYMNLGGPDMSPDRSHVLHVTFPAEWRIHELNHLFSPWGNIRVVWNNSTTAFVILLVKQPTDQIVRQLASHAECRVKSYREYRNSHSSRTPHVPRSDLPAPATKASDPRKRRRTSSESKKPSVDTIPEENEDTEEPTRSSPSKGKAGEAEVQQKSEDSGSAEECSPAKKRKVSPDSTGKLFAEPDGW